MEAEFTKAMHDAQKALSTDGVDAALLSVKNFFESRQAAIKEFFDAMSLDETAQEMQKRLEQVKQLLEPDRASKPKEVSTFLEKLKAFLHEEFESRVEEMAQ